MEKVATGCLSFWEGGSLWVFDVPGGGEAPARNAFHSHHAFQLTLSLGGSFVLQLDSGRVQGPYALIAPNARHAFEARGLVALLFVAPESNAGRSLRQLLQGKEAAEISAEQVRDAPQLIRAAFEHSNDPKTALRVTGTMIANRIAGHVPRTIEPDRRVRQIIKWTNDHIDGQVTMSAAADTVGLSASRASHLFVEHTGLPYRTFVLWVRVMRATEAHSDGASLTEAAVAAGFADSAHFSRTFRRMFGLPAATLELS